MDKEHVFTNKLLQPFQETKEKQHLHWN